MKTHTVQLQVPVSPASFTAGLEGLTRENENLMGSAALPPLYQAGVRYRDEPRDVWRTADTVAREGWGDCEDLSAYRAAELRVSGEDPDASVGVYKSGQHRYHAIVVRGDGTVEDPSRALGMGAPKMPRIPRRAVNVLGADAMPDDRSITFEIIPIPGGGWGRPKGYKGFIRIPLGFNVPRSADVPGSPLVPAALTTVGPTASTPKAAEAAAAKSAASAIQQLASNPVVQSALAKVPGAGQAAAVLTDPTVVSVLKNPASLLNLQAALARPDIALQSAAGIASKIKSLFG